MDRVHGNHLDLCLQSAEAAPQFSLWDLILYGMIVIQPPRRCRFTA